MSGGKSKKIALCGMLSALSVVVLLMGNLIPLATYCAPALAALLILPVRDEYGARTALTMYAAVSLLALLLVPDRELGFMYVLVLGAYPVYKTRLERIPGRALQWLAKLAVFNAGILLAYALLLAVFAVPGLAAEFSDMGRWMLAALLLVGNISFILYDKALRNLDVLYRRVLRKKLMKML